MAWRPKINYDLPDFDLPSVGDIGHSFNKRFGLNPLSLIVTGGESGEVVYDEHLEEPLSEMKEPFAKGIGTVLGIGILYLLLKK